VLRTIGELCAGIERGYARWAKKRFHALMIVVGVLRV
jgi:hypothetical protein